MLTLEYRGKASFSRGPSQGEIKMANTAAQPSDVKKGRNTNQLVFLRKVVMKAMMQHRHSLPFRKPVDAKLLNLSDYHKIIKEPMDFGTIKSRLEKSFYRSAQECIQDFKLVFSNCYSYNQPEEEIVTNARDLETFFQAKIATMPKPEEEVDWEAKDVLVAKCSRETMGLQDYLSSYFAPSPGVEVRSRRCTERTSFGEISGNCSKKAGKGKRRGKRCNKKISKDAVACSQVKRGSKSPKGSSEVAYGSNVADGGKVDEVEQADYEEYVELEQNDGEVTDQDHVEPSPSLVTNMVHSWKDIEAVKANQQSSANFRSRIEHTSRPFKNWSIEASKEQKAKRGRLTEVSLPGVRVCALSSALAASKAVDGLMEEEVGGYIPDVEESGKNIAVEEDLNITVGFDEERLRGVAKVQSWLEGL